MRTAFGALRGAGWPIQAGLALFLVAVSFHNYLLFHTLAEAFAILIGVLMCVVAWQTYRFSRNDFLMYLANGYFWVAMLDLAHTLVYKGMNIFPIALANPATQFWIATRYFEALLLLSAPLFLTRGVNKAASFLGFAALAALLYGLIMSGNFPDAFIEGEGLTPFKVNSEYLISAILVASLVVLWRSRRVIGIETVTLMGAAILLTIVAELAFTFYVSVYGLSNLVGHIFKLFSFWLIFAAMVRTNLLKPYQLLQQEVVAKHEAERKLVIANQELEKRVQERTASLQESEAHLEEAQQIAHLGSWSLDLATNELTWSDEVYRIFGLEKHDFPASYEAFLDTIHPDDREFVEGRYQGALEGSHSYDIEHRIVRCNDGAVRWVHERCEHHRNEQGEVVRSSGTVQDITERQRMEQALRRSNEELQQFAHTVSHDLRSPLATIEGYLELIAEEHGNELHPTAAGYLVRSRRSAQQLQRLISDLLEFSRISQEPAQLHPINSSAAVESALAGLTAEIVRTGAEISVGELPRVLGNDMQLTRLFQNLFSNAIKYQPEGQIPRIEVTASRDERDQWLFTVRDNGVGIQQEHREIIFNAFQRLHARGEYEGTGIGLASCRRIVEYHRGRIWVESAPGEGSAFKFTLHAPP